MRALGRVSVGGHSMEPTLRHGDALLYAGTRLRAGDIAVAEADGAWVVKRVVSIEPDGSVRLASDSAAHGALTVARDAIVGRVLLRYAPIRRARVL